MPPRKRVWTSEQARGASRKGKGYERQVAAVLRRVWPGARRGIGQSRAAGEVPDVDGTPYWIEAKHWAHVPIRKAFEQGVAAAAGRRRVIVVSKDTGHPPDLVTMPLDVFLALVALAGPDLPPGP